MNNIKNLNITNPYYFYRDFRNDLIDYKILTKDSGREFVRYSNIVIPFLSLYKPLARPLSLVLGASRCISNVGNLLSTIREDATAQDLVALIQTKEGIRNFLDIAISVSAIACILYAPLLGTIVTSSHDILKSSYNLCECLYQSGTSRHAKFYREKAFKEGIHLVNNTLFLSTMLFGSTYFVMGSLACQAGLGAYNAYKAYEKGEQPEMIAHLAMSCIRGYQAGSIGYQLTHHREMTALPPWAQEQKEKDAISQDPHIKGHDYTIDRIEKDGTHYYMVKTENETFRVDINYIPDPDGMCGPAHFDLSFTQSQT